MFEVTSHGMNFTTFLPNQAHTGNTFLLHSDSLRFSGFRNGECGGNNYVLQIFVCNIGLLHFLGRGACRQRRRLCIVTQALPEWRGQNT